MVEIDGIDVVVEITDFPLQDVGAPMPIVLADDFDLFLAYFMKGEAWALVRFHHPVFHQLGGPNDEAFPGHPLFAKGLDAHGIYEVKGSSLIARLERMQEGHPNYNPNHKPWHETLRHFIFTFKEQPFECVVESFEIETCDREDGRFDAMLAHFCKRTNSAL